jgi:hypothetical protein
MAARRGRDGLESDQPIRFLPSKPNREPLPSDAISDRIENDIER